MPVHEIKNISISSFHCKSYFPILIVPRSKSRNNDILNTALNLFLAFSHKVRRISHTVIGGFVELHGHYFLPFLNRQKNPIKPLVLELLANHSLHISTLERNAATLSCIGWRSRNLRNRNFSLHLLPNLPLIGETTRAWDRVVR